VKILISPNEKVFDPNTNEELGMRCCDMHETGFEVAPPLYWVDCSESVNPSDYYYDGEQLKEIPSMPVSTIQPDMPVTVVGE
jgi:hypothetical protein